MLVITYQGDPLFEYMPKKCPGKTCRTYGMATYRLQSQLLSRGSPPALDARIYI